VNLRGLAKSGAPLLTSTTKAVKIRQRRRSLAAFIRQMMNAVLRAHGTQGLKEHQSQVRGQFQARVGPCWARPRLNQQGGQQMEDHRGKAAIILLGKPANNQPCPQSQSSMKQ